MIKRMANLLEAYLIEKVSDVYVANLEKAEKFAKKTILPELKKLFKDERGFYTPDMSKTKVKMLDGFMNFTGFDLAPTAVGELFDASRDQHVKEKEKQALKTLEKALKQFGKQLEKELGFECVTEVFADKHEAGIILGGSKMYGKE